MRLGEKHDIDPFALAEGAIVAKIGCRSGPRNVATRVIAQGGPECGREIADEQECAAIRPPGGQPDGSPHVNRRIPMALRPAGEEKRAPSQMRCAGRCSAIATAALRDKTEGAAADVRLIEGGTPGGCPGIRGSADPGGTPVMD